jgi:hypothetical protein
MPGSDVERIAALPDAKVIDRTARMLLVETSEDKVPPGASEMADWAVSIEEFTPLPPRGPRIRTKAE